MLRDPPTLAAGDQAENQAATSEGGQTGYSGAERRRHPRVTFDGSSGASAEAKPQDEFSGIERRRHPRVRMDGADDAAGGDRRQGDRRQGERRQGDRRQGDRRQGDRRSMDALRSEMQWTAAPAKGRNARFGFWQSLRMKPSRIALLAVALVAGGMAAVLATQGQRTPARPAPKPVVRAPQVELAKVLVARTTIPAGQRLTPKVVEWTDWPKDNVLPQYLVKAKAPDALKKMAGSVARTQIFAGDPVTPEKVAPAGSGFLSGVLAKGMRAVSVRVSAQSASGGFIVPGDHVDVVLTRSLHGVGDSERILGNVRVMAINSRVGAPAPSGNDRPSTDTFSGNAIATLELTGAQAGLVINAETVGKLSLVLRSSSDSTDAHTADEAAANAAIRMSSPFWAAVPGNGAPR